MSIGQRERTCAAAVVPGVVSARASMAASVAAWGPAAHSAFVGFTAALRACAPPAMAATNSARAFALCSTQVAGMMRG